MDGRRQRSKQLSSKLFVDSLNIRWSWVAAQEVEHWALYSKDPGSNAYWRSDFLIFFILPLIAFKFVSPQRNNNQILNSAFQDPILNNIISGTSGILNKTKQYHQCTLRYATILTY